MNSEARRIKRMSAVAEAAAAKNNGEKKKTVKEKKKSLSSIGLRWLMSSDVIWLKNICLQVRTSCLRGFNASSPEH